MRVWLADCAGATKRVGLLPVLGFRVADLTLLETGGGMRA